MSTPSTVTYTGDGSTTDFTFPFEYIDDAYVLVTLDGVDTEYTLISQNTVRLSPAPAVGVSVRVYRETPGDALVNWADGAMILGRDLNTATKQPRHIAEEARDFVSNTHDDIATMADAAAASAAAAAASEAGVAADAATASAAASTATTKAAEASASEIAAAASEAAAAASEATATAAASTATTKASEALASASAASDSASAAAASAASAAASVVAAASSYDGFDDRYLGQKAADPTVDNDGNALVVGALYFNTVTEKMKIYTGASWQLAFNDTVAASAIENDSLVDGATVAAALNTLKTKTDDGTKGDITVSASGATMTIGNNAVTTSKITDANVTTAKIADSNVTTAKIADSNVTTAKIADSNVTTAKIADANVTPAKLSVLTGLSTTQRDNLADQIFKSVLNSTDCNDLLSPGTYFADASAANTPSPGSQYWIEVRQHPTTTDYLVQMAYQKGGASIWYRRREAGSFTAWSQVYPAPSAPLALIGSTVIGSSVAYVEHTFTTATYSGILVLYENIVGTAVDTIRISLRHSGGEVVGSTGNGGGSAGDRHAGQALFSLSNSGTYKGATVHLVDVTVNTAGTASAISDYRGAAPTTAADRVRVARNSGNLTGGTVYVYGIERS